MVSGVTRNQPAGLFGREIRTSGRHLLKRHGNLFNQIFTPENLHQAFLDARRGKRKKWACFQFETNLGHNLAALHREIHDGTYRPRPYFKFKVYEPKERIIHAPAFRDIVVQHAIYRVIYPLFNATFIDQSFACRVGMGTHRASDYTQRALKQCDPNSYTLKLDVRKFFHSIDRSILRGLIERRIKDRRLVDLMMLYAECDGPTGIPIGNLLSQLYALIYLNPLDHFVKRVLGVRHYVRYVDDFVLIGLTREQCLEYRERIVAYLESALRLTLSKSTLQRAKRGINFVGYRTWRGKRFIRKFSLYRFRRALRKGDVRALASILGHACRTNSLPHMLRLIEESNYAGHIPLPQDRRRVHHLHPAGRGTYRAVRAA